MKYEFTLNVGDMFTPIMTAHDDLDVVDWEKSLIVTLTSGEGVTHTVYSVPPETFALLRRALDVLSEHPATEHFYPEAPPYQRLLTEALQSADFGTVRPAIKVAGEIDDLALSLHSTVRNCKRDYTSVGDVANACRALLSKTIELYVIGDLLGNAD